MSKYHQYRNTHDLLFEMAFQRHKYDDLVDFAPIFPIMSEPAPEHATWTLITKSHGRSDFTWEYEAGDSWVTEKTVDGNIIVLHWKEFPEYYPLTFMETTS